MTKSKRAVIALSKHLYLAPLIPDYAPHLFKWINDPKVYGHLRDMNHVSPIEEQAAWIRSAAQDPSLCVMAIFNLSDDILIGYGGFKNISWEDQVGEIWRVIGETQYHGKGLGTELYTLIAKVGFEVLGFKNILAEHYSNNPASLKSAVKAGARQLGTRRNAKRIQGQCFDIHYTDLLPGELLGIEGVKIKEGDLLKKPHPTSATAFPFNSVRQ